MNAEIVYSTLCPYSVQVYNQFRDVPNLTWTCIDVNKKTRKRPLFPQEYVREVPTLLVIGGQNTYTGMIVGLPAITNYLTNNKSRNNKRLFFYWGWK